MDFSYNNVNVQNIKDAFEHFSDVVVSDFDPFSDKKVLDILLIDLKKSDTFDKFFAVFMAIYKDAVKRDDPESYLDFESSLKKFDGQGLEIGEEFAYKDFTIELFPAYTIKKSTHPKGNNWTGTIIESAGKSVYHAGDTERIPEMKDLKNRQP